MDDLQLKDRPRISPEEVARRREAVRQADADNRIEGIFRDPASSEIVEVFVRGDFEISELVPRLKARLSFS